MIELITGPMFSGKSTLLFQKMERYVFAHKRVLLIRPNRDTRAFFSHSSLDNSLQKLADSGKIKVELLSEFTDSTSTQFESFDAIFIDEFFMIKNCKKFATNSREHQDIYFAGLLSTSECTLFEEVTSLLPYCDSIIKLNGVCTSCGSQIGNYSYYTKGKKTSDIVVGDGEYTCLCRECYLKNQEQNKLQEFITFK